MVAGRGEIEPVDLAGVERQLQPEVERRAVRLPLVPLLRSAGGEDVGDPEPERSSAPQVAVRPEQDDREALLGHESKGCGR